MPLKDTKEMSAFGQERLPSTRLASLGSEFLLCFFFYFTISQDSGNTALFIHYFIYLFGFRTALVLAFFLTALLLRGVFSSSPHTFSAKLC